jgi:alkylation response protein AidB-like acyl-CoA dehydrogenase
MDAVVTGEALAETLFAAAGAVEASGEVPRDHLDLLADNGFYGIFGPPALGGLTDREAWRTVETIASGCLATAFVWVQHHSAVKAVEASLQPGICATYLEAMCRGEVRAGLALGGLRPGPASLRARVVPDGYELTGAAPWVTGWGLVDVIHVAARLDDDTIVWALLDARPGATLTAEPLELVAVTASRTATLHFDGHPVPAERVTGTLPYAQWPPRDAAGLRLNGSLALGVADRCRRLLAETSPDDNGLAASLARDVDAARSALDAASPAYLPAARAGASELALRAAATLLTAVGARAILAGETPQRLLREASFLLVFGSRPQIRADLLRRISHARS